MILLNKPITSFTFDDIVEFCKTNEREGVQLDYKADLTTGSLSKHFAAFSNTRGGIIIIGVTEDKKTGLPIKYDGVPVNAQDIERITQWANNVEPLPKWEIHPTDSKDDKRFILIRIYEGDETPYYVQNDANVWVRTENISKELFDIAKPDYANLLYKKRERSAQARDYYLERASDVLSAYLTRANHVASNAGQDITPTTQYKYRDYFSSARRLLTVTIQPNYPGRQLTDPITLSTDLREYQSRDHGGYYKFPSDINEAIPEGIANFEYGIDNITYTCEQIYAQGLIYYRSSIGDFDPGKEEKIYLDYIIGQILIVLKAAQKYYRLFGYQGILKGAVSLTGAQEVKLMPYWGGFKTEGKDILLSHYGWEVESDTRVFFNEEEFTKYFMELSKKIYWDLGFKQFYESALIKSLQQSNLIPK